MNEAGLKKALKDKLKELYPSAVPIRHEDTFVGGIPDLSVTHLGRVVWVEVKFYRPGRPSLPTPKQERMLERLGGLLLTYRQYADGSRGVFVVDYGADLDATNWSVPGGTTPRGWDHERVANLIMSHMAR